MKTEILLIFTKQLKIVLSVAVILACSAAVYAESKLPSRDAEDAQSKSSPIRPPELEEIARQSTSEAITLDYEVLIEGVPTYIWHRGCGPTSVGMILGYYDGQGYVDLVPGAADTQTTAVDDMIASPGHYTDYSLPKDYYPDMIPDGSETNVGGCHADNSVADFFETSQSAVGNYWGWSWFSKCDDSFRQYVELASAEYTPSAEGEVWAAMTWERLTQEIDSNRPCIFLVDSSGSGGSDHFVPIIGYGELNGTNMYACYDTWDHDVHWYTFRGMSASYTYGIYGAIYFSLAPLPQSEPSKAINPSPTNGATGVSTSPTLTWSDGGGAQGYDIYWGTNPTPGVTEYQGSQSGASYSPGSLGLGVTYYWRIDASNSLGTATGDVWSFTTFDPVIHYVSHDGGHVPPFSSWANASTSIQAAIDVADPTDWVCVTNGIYTPGTQLSVTSDILMVSENGAEATTITGQNAHAIIRLTTGTVRGFTLTGGETTAEGGAVLFGGGGSVEQCILSGNAAGDGGGAYFLSGGTLVSCLIRNNTAGKGGGLYFDAGGLLQNCTVTRNEATRNRGGGGFYTTGAGSTIYNSIIYHNTGSNGSNYYENAGGAMYWKTCSAPLLGGFYNLSSDPLFEDPGGNDFHLRTNSACINNGTNQAWMSTARDLDGNTRLASGIVDIGAYENQPPALPEYDLEIVSHQGSPSPAVGLHAYEVDTLVPCSVASPLNGTSTQLVCTGWTMIGNNPLSGSTNGVDVTVTNDAVLTWLWTTNVAFSSTASGGGSITGDADGWYPLGASVTVTAAPNALFEFAGWSGDTEGDTNALEMTVTLDYARHLDAHFADRRPVIEIISTHGSVTPGVGLFTNNYGSVNIYSVSESETTGSTQYVNTGWVMTGNSPLSGSANMFVLVATNDAVLTWLWTTNVQLVTDTEGPGSLSGDTTGWYALGGGITVTATADPQYYFTGWSGDVPAVDTNDNPLMLTMDHSKTLTAHFSYHTPDSEDLFATNSGVSTCWAADPGGVYQLLGSSDLCNPVWSNVSSIVTATSDCVILVDTNCEAACMMYRAVRIFP